MRTSRSRRICYLCGKPGADSKDHLPPKALLPPPSDTYPRLTVPAHVECNRDPSADEEYVRDLIIPEAIQFGFKDAQAAYEKVWRAWSMEGGWARYQRFLKDHVPVQMRTPGGLYAGRAVGIKPEQDKLLRVGKKIVRGLIFHDSGAVVGETDVIVATLPTRDVPATRERDAQEQYWRSLSSEACLHTMCGEPCAMRRIYIGRPASGEILLEAHFAVMLWTLFYAASAVFPLSSATKRAFAFAVDESSGEWVRSSPDASLQSV